MSAWRFLDRVVSFFTFPIRSVVRQRDAEIATEIRSVRNAINRYITRQSAAPFGTQGKEGSD